MALAILSGMRLTPTRINAAVPIEASKPGDLSRTNTATVAADPDLVITIPAANAVYMLEALLIAVSAANAAGDVQYGFSYPAGATLTLLGPGPHNGLPSGSGAEGEWIVRGPAGSPSTAIPYGASTVATGALLKGRLVVGATTGALTLRWAQQAANPASTTLKAGSYLRLTRVG